MRPASTYRTPAGPRWPGGRCRMVRSHERHAQLSRPLIWLLALLAGCIGCTDHAGDHLRAGQHHHRHVRRRSLRSQYGAFGVAFASVDKLMLSICLHYSPPSGIGMLVATCKCPCRATCLTTLPLILAAPRRRRMETETDELYAATPRWHYYCEAYAWRTCFGDSLVTGLVPAVESAFGHGERRARGSWPSGQGG